MKVAIRRYAKAKDLKKAAKSNDWPTMYLLVDQHHIDSGEYVPVRVTIEEDK